MRAQRIYNDSKWPNAVTLRITDAHPAVDPPHVGTTSAKPGNEGTASLGGELFDLGNAESVEVGCQYRRKHDNTQPLSTADPWQTSPLRRLSAAGRYTVEVTGLEPGQAYDFRAVVKHPKITLYGDLQGFVANP